MTCFLAIDKIIMVYNNSGVWSRSLFISGLLDDTGIRIVNGLIINAEIFIPESLACPLMNAEILLP